MAIEITQEEVKVLSEISYMNNLDEFKKNGSLKDMAKTLLNQKNEGITREFGGWGGFTNDEHYKMLQGIANDQYPNLSKLSIKDYENHEDGDGFVAYAFTDGNKNVISAFRGTMGTRVGQDSDSDQIKGYTNSSWTNNYDLGLNDASLQFAPTKDFVTRNMEGGGNFVTGHSQGAANAAYACASIPGVTGFAFDGPGIGQDLTPTQNERLAASGFINCVNQNDAVGALLFHPEQRIYGKFFQSADLNPDGSPKMENGQIKNRDGISAAHYLQAFQFDGGNVIQGERSVKSIAIEGATKALYVENKLHGNTLGLVVDGLHLSRGDWEGYAKVHSEQFQTRNETLKEYGDAIIQPLRTDLTTYADRIANSNEPGVSIGTPAGIDITPYVDKATTWATDGINNVINQRDLRNAMGYIGAYGCPVEEVASRIDEYAKNGKLEDLRSRGLAVDKEIGQILADRSPEVTNKLMQSVYEGGVDNQIADYKKVIEVYHNAGFTGVDNQVEYVKGVQAERVAQQQAEKIADQARIQETKNLEATTGLNMTLGYEGQANVKKPMTFTLDVNAFEAAVAGSRTLDIESLNQGQSIKR